MNSEIDKQKQANPKSQGQFAGPARARSKGRNIFIALIVIAVAGVGVMMAKSKLSDPVDKTRSTYITHRGDLLITVTEGGSIRAKESTNYTCDVERRGGELNILKVVAAGTYVTQEDVDRGLELVVLDSSSLDESLKREEIELSGDRESKVSAWESLLIQKLQNKSNVASDQLKLRFALMAFQKYLGNKMAGEIIEVVESKLGLTKHVEPSFDKVRQDANLPKSSDAGEELKSLSNSIVPVEEAFEKEDSITSLTEYVAPFLEKVRQDPNLLDGSAAGQELKSLNDAITLAKGNLKNAEATLAGTEQLHEAEYVSKLDLERDRLTVMNREFSLQNAIVNLDLFLRYDFPKNTEQYLSDYIEARRQLERTHAQCRSMMAQAQAKLSNAEEELASQERRVEWYREQIAKCTIKAKKPGLVIYGTGGSSDAYSAMRRRGYSGGGGSGIIAAGESVYQGQTLLSMPDTNTMIAEISVHETEVDKVRAGQPAQIIMDAFPDKILEGEVLEVAPLPDQQRGFMNPDLKVYKTLVSINGTHDFLKTRMSCKVEIFVREINDVILVPIQVVANRGGRKVVFMAGKGKAEEREVNTGAFNDSFVQIIEGLEEGEEVLLNPPLFTESRQLPSSKRSRSGKKSDSDNKDKSDQDSSNAGQLDAEKKPAEGERERRGEWRGAGSGRSRGGRPGTMPGDGQMSDEMKERARQWEQMSEEDRAKMRQRFGGGRRGQGRPDGPRQETPDKPAPKE